MKKIMMVVLVLAGFSLSATSRMQPQALKIEFHSYGMGIASGALETAQSMIGQALTNGKINSFQKTPWGREGEVTLCVEAAYDVLYPIYQAMGQMEVDAGRPAPMMTFMNSCQDMPSFPGMEMGR